MNIPVGIFDSVIMAKVHAMIDDHEIEHCVRLSLVFAHDARGRHVDLKRLATFKDGDFWHDVVGIDNHASREHETCGLLTGGFVPRCGFATED